MERMMDCWSGVLCPPRVDEDRGRQSREGVRKAPSQATILLVEDHDDFRRLVGRMLRLFGYRVVEASQGVQALNLYQQAQEPIDLIVTDVTMPQMSGTEFVAQLQRQDQRVKVLYMSGHAEESLKQCGALDGGASFIRKPFSFETMSRRIQTLLADPQP